jgi:ribosomal protein S18 acetylase RimI-like enzyme
VAFRELPNDHSQRSAALIRPTSPADTEVLVPLAQETGVFKPHEIRALREVLDDYHNTNQRLGHRCVTFEQSGQILGFAYYAPAQMTDRTWYLYWIAVTRQTQARGIGGKLLKHVEEDIQRLQGRVLFIETSSLPNYELTRKFYIKHKYDHGATLVGYYADGDDMIVFRKHFGAPLAK